MKSDKVKENLINNTNLLIQALEHYGFAHIKEFGGKEIRCGYSEDSNPTSVVINLDNLYSTIWSKNVKGDIYSILCWNSGQTFNQVHNYLSSLFGGEAKQVEVKRKQLFGGVFRKFIGNQTEVTDHVYSEDDLKAYSKRPNQRFLDDGISIKTQMKFGVGYDFQNHYITINWRNTEGEVIGVKGRNNDDDCGDYKYIALKKFKKTNHLYGYYENRDKILEERTITLFESEKATMQCDSFGFNRCASVGSHSISEQQIRLMKYDVDKIIIGYDTDVTEDVLEDECKKIKRILPNVKVGYILDKNGLLGKKCSPTDLGKEVFSKLIKNNIIWYRGVENE